MELGQQGATDSCAIIAPAGPPVPRETHATVTRAILAVFGALGILPAVAVAVVAVAAAVFALAGLLASLRLATAPAALTAVPVPVAVAVPVTGTEVAEVLGEWTSGWW